MKAVLNAKAAYEEWHARLAVDSESQNPWHDLIRNHLNPVRDLIGKRVLEIGCGRGEFTCWMARQKQRPAEIVAADFAETAVRKGREFAAANGWSGISWEVEDIQAISHASNSFDTVISCETIEHVPNPRLAIKELARVLKPGGRLLLTTPNYLGVFGLYRGFLRLTGRRFTEEGQPINNFTMLPLTCQWVRNAGLRIKAVDGIGHYLLLPGRLPREIPAFNNPRPLMRWLAMHSLVIAEKENSKA